MVQNKHHSGLRFCWKVTNAEDGMLLREFLRDEKQISKRALADIKFSGGKLIVNDEEVTVRKPLLEGDEVIVQFPPETLSEAIVPMKLPFSIIYEDKHVLVINKAAHMATIPSREHPSHTLAHAVLCYYQEQGWQATFHAINRLDKDTSGLLLVAKHRHAHELFSRCQKNGLLERRYLAIVHGELEQDSGVIDAPIARKSESIIERTVCKAGQHAITHYKVKERLNGATVVDVQLETGRTHQIRVHFSYLGHPLFGDSLYGGKRLDIERQALHSHQLRFYHPFLEREMSFSAPLPDDMERLLNRLKKA